jgi:DNA-binding MarR family transcriptional regulator
MTADLAPLLHQLLLAAHQLHAQNRARADMTTSEYAGLQHLVHDHDGLTPGQLASRLAITSGSITKLVDRLEARRLVRRIRHPHADRRSITVIATPQGVNLIKRDLELLVEQLPQPHALVDQDQQKAFAQLLTLLDSQTNPPIPTS